MYSSTGTAMDVYKGFWIHCKKRLSIFPSLAGTSLTKLSLAGNNLIIPYQGDFGEIPAGLVVLKK
jgi:hypothetical protein